MSRQITAFPLRMEHALRSYLEARAKSNRRSLNEELLARLRDSAVADEDSVIVDVRLPIAVEQELRTAAAENGRSVDEEVETRLRAFLDRSPGASP